MRATRFMMAAILLLANGNLYAKSLVEAETNAKNYSVQGVTFGMSLSDFDKKFSVSQPLAMDSSNGTVKREIVASAEKTAQFHFYRGRLFAVSLIYAFQGNDRVERETAVAEQLNKMFGNPHHSDDAALFWSFPKVNRNISCAPSQANLIVRVWDTSVEK